MDEPIMLSEVSQTKTNIIYHLYVEPKNLVQMTYLQNSAAIHGVAKSQTRLSDWTEQTHRLRKQTYSYQRGKMQGRDKLGIWD